MTANWYAGDSVCDSQNFNLRLSEDSTIEDSSPQRFIRNEKAEDDVIVISDSSCSSSPVCTDKPKWKANSISNVRNKEYKKLYFLDNSSSESEKEKESDSSGKLGRSDNKFSKRKSINRTVQIDISTDNETSISNDNLLSSERLYDNLLTSNDALIDKTAVNINYDRDQANKCKKYINGTNPTLNTEQKINSKLRQEHNTEKIYRVVKPGCAVYSDSPNILSRYPTCNTPKQDNTGKARLTTKDTYKILKNIKCTQVVYDSPREKKDVNNVIINESTDIDDDMHPAISPSYNRKVQNPSDSPDIIDASLRNDILQEDLSESSKPRINMSKVMNSFIPLSERRKKQIREWLLTNFSDSQSDSSFNTVPPSTRNSNSGNSSLERLELNYETPNNRERIKKAQTDKKQGTIINSDAVVNSFFTRQTTLGQYFKKSKNNSEFCTPDNKPKLLPKAQTDKKASSAVNTFEAKNVPDCVNILDKLYGKSWRNKADVLLPTTEPQKTSIQIENRIVQIERKPVSKNRYHATDLDSDKFKLVENNIKPNRGRNIQQKQKETNSFINDKSLSSSDSESIYHTAITNATTFTSNSTKSVPVSASIKRLQTLCDTDTDDEDDKSNNDPKTLHRRKLSFSDDESSSTSEFDPGDYVPPKYVRNKEVTKKPISQVAAKFESTMTKSIKYKTFLTSLSNMIPMYQAHPNAKKYRLDYKNNKKELCKKLYVLYNEKVFDDKLPRDMSIEWNVRMRGTAGYCYNKKSTRGLSVIKSSRIVLATKILDTPDRLRDTLIHEMCHAASWIIDDVSDGHGLFWTRWANKAMKTFPELPPIRRCHNYEIKTKFTYRCTGCGYSIGRHSKSLDIEKKRCGYCYGKFELLMNKTTKSGIVQVQTPKREPTAFALYVKQNYNSVKKEKSTMKHADVMKLLGQQFSAIKIAKKADVGSN